MLSRFLHSPSGRSVRVSAGFALLIVGAAEIPVTPASLLCVAAGWAVVVAALADTRGHWRTHA